VLCATGACGGESRRADGHGGETGQGGAGAQDAGFTGTPVDPEDLRSFCADYARATCDALVPCCAGAGKPYADEDCVEWELDACAVSFMMAVGDQATMAGCLAERSTLTDCHFTQDEFPSCGRLLRPKYKRAGSVCATSEECADSKTAAGTCLESRCTELRYAREGEACEDELVTCQPELFCIGRPGLEARTCARLGALGASCDTFADCASQRCDADAHVCAEQSSLGDCPRE
jgi:hypothetical protein